MKIFLFLFLIFENPILNHLSFRSTRCKLLSVFVQSSASHLSVGVRVLEVELLSDDRGRQVGGVAKTGLEVAADPILIHADEDVAESEADSDVADPLDSADFAGDGLARAVVEMAVPVGFEGKLGRPRPLVVSLASNDVAAEHFFVLFD
jgi:hypothetical protein